ncbi:MAG: 2-oxo acid dehydrogenase subunit E2 [Candidatus Thermoplasmatota archaeon]|nr:2-oxo acid dehydrogenase subunit E2 [Candidatus Thermoplasmatota archaeon]
MFEFKLPDIGEGVAEGEIVKWHVKPGDTISSDQEMVEVMTDKVTVKISSPVSGTVKEILAKEGTISKVGDLLIRIDDGKSETSTNLATQTEEPAKSEAPQAQSQPQEKPQASKISATPAIRKAAKDMGIDLEKVTPSGENGRITMKDLEAYAAAAKAADQKKPVLSHEASKSAEKPAPRPGMEEVYEPKGLRRIIFDKMSKSKSIIPHFMIGEYIDFTKMREAREDLKSRDKNVTFTPIFVKAITIALKEFPKFNAIYDERSKTYSIKKYYNIGIAVDTQEGLNVVVIKDADKKNVFAISQELADMASRARSNKLTLSDVQDSTFTITNVGTIGGIFSTPIINYPEVAIIGFHRTLNEDMQNPNSREFMYVTMSCDHRLIDGADDGHFGIVERQGS